MNNNRPHTSSSIPRTIPNLNPIHPLFRPLFEEKEDDLGLANNVKGIHDIDLMSSSISLIINLLTRIIVNEAE